MAHHPGCHVGVLLMPAFGPIPVELRGYSPPRFRDVALVGHNECNYICGLVVEGHEYNRSGTCGEGHCGHAVGRAYRVLDDGTIDWMPEGTNWLDAAPWNRNTVDEWCCGTCMVRKSSAPDAYDAPREAFIYPTCFGPVVLCDGIGSDDVGHKGGTCPAEQE